MKTKLFLAFTISLLVISCGQDSKDGDRTISSDVVNIQATASGKVADPGSAPNIAFEEDKHDFGKITQGEIVSFSYVFKNNGGSDLVISSAQGSCGCTIPEFPKGAIKPGEQGKVDVKFDSSGKSGLVQKTVTLITNCTPSTRVLTVVATVDVPEED
jgi:hypothetical protein